MGKVIADALDGELDVVLVRKLGAPGNPELAIGSIDETGQLLLGDYTRTLGISERYIEAEKEAQLNTLQKRRAEYTPVRPPIDPANRIVILVDDGVATGATMRAALRALRAKGPARLIAAMGVARPVPGQRLEARPMKYSPLCAQPILRGGPSSSRSSSRSPTRSHRGPSLEWRRGA
jgi:predicted phosphoribosyltransferase